MKLKPLSGNPGWHFVLYFFVFSLLIKLTYQALNYNARVTWNHCTKIASTTKLNMPHNTVKLRALRDLQYVIYGKMDMYPIRALQASKKIPRLFGTTNILNFANWFRNEMMSTTFEIMQRDHFYTTDIGKIL